MDALVIYLVVMLTFARVTSFLRFFWLKFGDVTGADVISDKA